MKIKFKINCFGCSVEKPDNYFETEIEEWEIEEMSEEEKQEYIENHIYDYIVDNMEFQYKIKE